jgi:hypothetical protein
VSSTDRRAFAGMTGKVPDCSSTGKGGMICSPMLDMASPSRYSVATTPRSGLYMLGVFDDLIICYLLLFVVPPGAIVTPSGISW